MRCALVVRKWDLAAHVAETPDRLVARVNIARDMFLRENHGAGER